MINSQATRVSLNKRIWRLSWPVMISNAAVPLVALVDTAVLGHLDDTRALGAAALANALFMFVAALFSFLRMSTTGQVAQAYGTDYQAVIYQVAVRSLKVGLMLSCAIALLLPWAGEPLLHWLSADPALTPLAQEYFEIRSYALPAIAIQYWLVGVLIGTQKPKLCLLILVGANAVNAGLDIVLVYGFNGGALAVAWASTLAEYLVVLFAIYWWLKTTTLWHKRLTADSTEALNRINQHGRGIHFNLLIRTFLLLCVMTSFTAFGARLDTNILSANAIFMSLLLLISHVLDSFAHAAEALVGEKIGAHRWSELSPVLTYTALWSIFASIFIFGALLLFDDPIFNLITNQKNVTSTLETYRIWLWLLPLVAWMSYWVDGVMVGSGDSTAMRNGMIFSAIGFYCFWGMLPQNNPSLWLSFYAFLVLRFLSLLPNLLKLLSKSREIR